MTTSTAFSAQGTIVYINTAGTAFAAIANVKSFSDLEGGSASDIDRTHMRSTAKEFLSGLQDSGTCTLEVDMDLSDPGQAAVQAHKISGAVASFQVQLPPGATSPDMASFSGFVRKFSKSGSVDATVKGSIEIRISGDVTWA